MYTDVSLDYDVFPKTNKDKMFTFFFFKKFILKSTEMRIKGLTQAYKDYSS